MGWQMVIGGSGAVICVMLAFASPTFAADTACGDGASCSAPLDDSSVGNNQSGDAGADREPPDDKKKG
jgi:hypothetical protein